ncbi:MAG: hypothetical protein Q8S11_10485 [Daejeonella sp.]|uniref:hypothetical protein n=1 Tax=Daejeonella sp. TaxID=2805397 RepID=UPI0027347CB4|nr:hypothetical protein [Daejeonella sp.]MDP3468751.1 hypothetical protein [Daejeonella sp.]
MKNFKIALFALFTFASISVNAQPKPKAERPYTILERGQHMTRLSIIKDIRAEENTVQIEAVNASGGTPRIEGPDMAGADITNILATVGSYNKIQEISKTGRGEVVQIQQVQFPFKVRITISNQVLEVMFKEEGFWKITVGMNQ